MTRYSDYSEVYIATSVASTSENFSTISVKFCTKQQVLFPGLGEADYLSNVSVLPKTTTCPTKPSVRVSSNSTVHSMRESIEDTILDHVSARDMLYHWEKQDRGRLASVYAVYFVEKNFSMMNLEVINSLLLGAVPSRLTPWSMVALLRASYSARHLLPGWGVFYRAVKCELKDNERAPKLLMGLDQ